MAPKIINDIKNWLRQPSPKVVGGELQKRLFTGSGLSIVNSNDALDTYKDRQESVADIKAVLEHLHVRRNLEAVEQMAFANWGFKAVPPEDYNGTAQKQADEEREIVNRLWEFNKLWQIEKKIPMTFEAVKGYRYDLHEIYMGYIGKWEVPVYWEQLGPHSFGRSVPKYEGNKNYTADRLLKGIIYDNTKREYLYFQSQDPTTDPRQIPTENVFVITDPRVKDPQGHSYFSGLVSTIKSHNLGRMAFNQCLSRGGSPNMVVKVKNLPEDESDFGYVEATTDDNGQVLTTGEDIGTKQYKWWEYANDLARRQGKDSRLVVPEEIDLIWPDLKVALDPTKADHYFIQEIVDALVPVDPMKQLGTSLAKSSKELLDYLQDIFGGYQEACGAPYAELLTYVVNINGWDGWAIENAWKKLSPQDVKADKDHSLKSYQAGSITVTRYYEETGRPTPDPEELMQLYREMLIRAGRIDLLPGLTPELAGLTMKAQSSEAAGIKGLDVLQKDKEEGLTKILKDIGYFKVEAN